MNAREAARRWRGYRPPDLLRAAEMRAALDAVRAMTPQRVFESSVRVGIHNADGTLTRRYGGKYTLPRGATCSHPKMRECHPGCRHFFCPDCELSWDDASVAP